jgi:hypothetical protein
MTIQLAADNAVQLAFAIAIGLQPFMASPKQSIFPLQSYGESEQGIVAIA